MYYSILLFEPVFEHYQVSNITVKRVTGLKPTGADVRRLDRVEK